MRSGHPMAAHMPDQTPQDILRERIRPAMTWDGEFCDVDLEQRFARVHWLGTVRRMRAVCTLTATAYLLAFIGDSYAMAPGTGLWSMLGMRLAVFAMGIYVALRARACGETRRLGNLVAVYMLLVTLGESFELAVKYSSGAEPGMPVLVVMLLMFYFLKPPRLVPTMAAAVTGSLLYLAVLAWGVSTPVDYLVLMVLVCLLCNGFGIYFMNTFGRVQRREFLALEEERRFARRLREEMERRQEVEERLRKQASTDELTGVLNRRRFMELGRKEFLRAKRYGGPVSLLMIDADHFKRINDEHGHHVGDEALRLLATICKRSLRTEDLFGRLGGEEFAAVLPHTAPDRAAFVATRIQTLLRKTRLATSVGELDLTISVGVAEMGEAGLDEALLRADKALYRAKELGRDRVESAPPPAQPPQPRDAAGAMG